MARDRSSSPVQQKFSQALVSALSSAILEWLLIVMLFISALYSFLITKFARYCKLQIPCLLCSRLDHILGRERTGYLWHMICATHRLEISSLVSCHAHNQLVDVHNMCEGCLFSFATINKSNAETYRLLVGKLGENSNEDSDVDPLLESPMLQNQKTKYCSCCNKQWTLKGYVQKLVKTRSFGKRGVEFDLPSPPVRQNELTNITEKSLVRFENTYEQSQCGSPSRIDYKKVNITSDTESEISMSKDDDDDARVLVSQSTSSVIDVSVQRQQLEPSTTTLSDDFVTDNVLETDPAPALYRVGYKKVKISSDTESDVSMSNDNDVDARSLIFETPSPRIELSVQCKLPDPRTVTLADTSVIEKLLKPDPSSDHSFAMSKIIVDSHKNATTLFATAVGQHLEEFKQEQDGNHSDHFPPEELIHLDGVPQFPDSREFSAEASKGNFTSLVDDLTPDQVTEEKKVVSSDDVSSSPKATELPYEVPESKRQTSGDEVLSKAAKEDAEEVPKDQSGSVVLSEAEQTCIDVCKELDRSDDNGVDSETNVMICGNCLRRVSPLDLADAYKLAVGSRAKELSEVLTEQLVGMDSSRVSEDLKLLLSQLSAARGLNQQMNDMSPKISLSSDELKASAPSTSTGMQILQKRITLERNESTLSIDSSIVSEIEGESEVDRLKRQVEHDIRTIKSLYNELEEERNASATAANEAMAMIARLQEEKATIHMEALQSVRMMEEQAEFDIEAMQEANDLLAEREKEIQDLEAELEFYRQRYPDVSSFSSSILP